jgi:hypothetical protein
MPFVPFVNRDLRFITTLLIAIFVISFIYFIVVQFCKDEALYLFMLMVATNVA